MPLSLQLVYARIFQPDRTTSAKTEAIAELMTPNKLSSFQNCSVNYLFFLKLNKFFNMNVLSSKQTFSVTEIL